MFFNPIYPRKVHAQYGGWDEQSFGPSADPSSNVSSFNNAEIMPHYTTNSGINKWSANSMLPCSSNSQRLIENFGLRHTSKEQMGEVRVFGLKFSFLILFIHFLILFCPQYIFSSLPNVLYYL